MSYNADDTICAISSAVGGAARGLVRISGSDAIAIAFKLFRAEDGSSIEGSFPAIAITGTLRVSLHDSLLPLDRASQNRGKLDATCDLFVWPTYRSYTREPV